MSDKEYKISKEECQKNINGICLGCGSELEPIETVDNSGDPTFWPGCINCSRFTNGVSKVIYDITKAWVDTGYREYKENCKYSTQINGASGHVIFITNLFKMKTGLKKSNKIAECDHEIGQAEAWGCVFVQDLKKHGNLGCEIITWNNYCPKCGENLDALKAKIKEIAPDSISGFRKHQNGKVAYQSERGEIILDKDSFGYL